MKNIMKKQGRASKVGFIILCVFTLSFVGQAIPVTHAAIDGEVTQEYTLLSPLPCINNTCPGSHNDKTADFKTYVSYAYNLFIAIGAVTAVFMIVLGGFEYVTSTIPGVKTEGLGRIKGAVGGLVLILGSYLILRTINPQFVQISDTLVPKLVINNNLAKNSNGDYLSQLENEASRFSANDQQAIADRNAANANAAQAQGNVDSTNQQINAALGNPNPPLTDAQIDAACNDPEQSYTSNIDSLCVSRANYQSQVADYKAKAATSDAISLFNHSLTVLAANATQSNLDSTSQVLTPGAAADTRASSLAAIQQATSDILAADNKAYALINDPSNPQTPQYVQQLEQSADAAMLKAAETYVATYNANKPVSVPDTQSSILNILQYRDSFALSDPALNAQKNQVLNDLCGQEMKSIGQDPNSCIKN